MIKSPIATFIHVNHRLAKVMNVILKVTELKVQIKKREKKNLTRIIKLGT